MFTPIVGIYRFGEKGGTYESMTTVTFMVARLRLTVYAQV